MPSLTIAIPVYERLYGFQEALTSALAISEVSEILVVDNASSHSDFERIVHDANDHRLRYFRNNSNIGMFANWNRCGDLATGDFVSILGSDDLISEKFGKLFYNAISAHPDLDLFTGTFCLFDDSTSAVVIRKEYGSGVYTMRMMYEDAAREGLSFPVLFAVRTTLLREHRFIEHPHSGNDWLWAYDLAKHAKFVMADEPVGFWRTHGNQDHKASQHCTQDNWPLIYCLIAHELRLLNSPFSGLAKRRAIGVCLSWFINDKEPNGRWRDRIQSAEKSHHLFLSQVLKLIEKSWILSAIYKQTAPWLITYNIARVLRKLGVYPAM